MSDKFIYCIITVFCYDKFEERLVDLNCGK